jgi:hypothetical protein
MDALNSARDQIQTGSGGTYRRCTLTAATGQQLHAQANAKQWPARGTPLLKQPIGPTPLEEGLHPSRERTHTRQNNVAEATRCRKIRGIGQTLHGAGLALKRSDDRADVAEAGIDHQNSRLTHAPPQPDEDPQLAQVSAQRPT